MQVEIGVRVGELVIAFCVTDDVEGFGRHGCMSFLWKVVDGVLRGLSVVVKIYFEGGVASSRWSC